MDNILCSVKNIIRPIEGNEYSSFATRLPQGVKRMQYIAFVVSRNLLTLTLVRSGVNFEFGI
jgi:hypothetical protein